MTDFNTLQDLWQQQAPANKKEPVATIQKSIQEQKMLRYKQRSTIVILLLLISILIWYFIFFLQLPNARVKVSAALMIGAMLCRVLSEMLSHIQLGRINFTLSLKDYAKQFTQFYQFRKWVNFLIAPLTLLLYSLGFIYLLPALKGALSEGFYLYCVISGSLFLIGFSIFLFWNVRKEMKILNQMKLVDISLNKS